MAIFLLLLKLIALLNQIFIRIGFLKAHGNYKYRSMKTFQIEKDETS